MRIMSVNGVFWYFQMNTWCGFRNAVIAKHEIPQILFNGENSYDDNFNSERNVLFSIGNCFPKRTNGTGIEDMLLYKIMFLHYQKVNTFETHVYVSFCFHFHCYDSTEWMNDSLKYVKKQRKVKTDLSTYKLSKANSFLKQNVHLHYALCSMQAVHFARISKEVFYFRIGYFMSS